MLFFSVVHQFGELRVYFTVSRLLAAVLSLNTGSISKIVLPISHLDAKTFGNRVHKQTFDWNFSLVWDTEIFQVMIDWAMQSSMLLSVKLTG